MKYGSLERERESASGVSGVDGDIVVEMLSNGLLLPDVAERRDGKRRCRKVSGGNNWNWSWSWLLDNCWARTEGGWSSYGTRNRATRMSRSDGLGCGQRNSGGNISNWNVRSLGFKPLAGSVLDSLELAGLVDVAILSSDVAKIVTGLDFKVVINKLLILVN